MLKDLVRRVCVRRIVRERSLIMLSMSASEFSSSPRVFTPPDTSSAPSFLSPGILIIDDEPAIRTLLEAICRLRGFRVYQAESGRAGLELYRQERANISLVLLDVRMPGLDGPQTLAELRRCNPAVACCFMSGQTGSSPEELLALGALRFFPKPFAIRELAEELWTLAQQTLQRSA
jgi:DNA-binding response OmpR family regulator